MDRRVYIFYKKPIGRSEQPLRSALGLHMSPLHCRVQMNLNQIRSILILDTHAIPDFLFGFMRSPKLWPEWVNFPLIVFMFRFAHSFYARIYNSSSHHFVTSFTFYVFELLFWLHSILGQSPRPGMCHLRYKALQLHRMGADTHDLHRKVVSHEKQVRAVARRPSWNNVSSCVCSRQQSYSLAASVSHWLSANIKRDAYFLIHTVRIWGSS